jgi:phenylpyruvate tautomerase PptA (4-oxalocrotonate tautomerase family)
MPTVKIELLKGREISTLLEIKKVVLESMSESLRLPSNDQNIRIIEYEPGLFQMKPPYDILIEFSMFVGRTKETKKKLFQSVVDNLAAKCYIEKEKVLIIINEQPLENWGVRGGYPADEIDLGFKVNI